MEPDVTGYAALIDAFLDRRLAATEFESAYLRMVKSERRVLGDPVFPILQELFEEVDAFVADPRLRDSPDDLDETTLLQCAWEAREALRDNGFG